MPCHTCEGSGFAGAVTYLRPDDRPRMYSTRAPAVLHLAPLAPGEATAALRPVSTASGFAMLQQCLISVSKRL